MKGNHLFDGDLVAGGVDDEEVAIDGDEQDREGGEEDAGGLDDPRQLAQDFLIMVVVVVMRVAAMMVVIVMKMVFASLHRISSGQGIWVGGEIKPAPALLGFPERRERAQLTAEFFVRTKSISGD